MALAPGTRLGPYEVTAQIGVGGMGEVYRATDTNLKRQVAIKVLPESVATDRERLARFQREAEVLAALNHPHIAHIYGVEKSDGTTALVMELVEGPTLADRIAKGPIPVDEALPVARQIAEALEAAHEQGIVHRDLKPANIKVRDDGTVKVLDFGLAKAMEPAGASGATSASASMSPTITTPAMTQMGMILGTAAYMSPEQAKGKAVDKRADIWAFGVVLYEMATGRRLFEGEDLTETIAAVVMKAPDLSAAPAELQRVLRRCLEKDPRKRLRDISVVWEFLDESTPVAAAATTAPRRSWQSWTLAAAAILAVLSTGWLFLRPTASVPQLYEFTFGLPIDGVQGTLTHLSLSPDGRQIAVAGFFGREHQLWVRSLDDSEPRRLVATESPDYPFWSPDSRYIAYFSGRELRKVAASGGPSVKISDAEYGMGGTWNADGVIVFVPERNGEIQRVAEGGGTPVDVPQPRAGDVRPGRRFPTFLPDGRHFLYTEIGAAEETNGIYLASIDGGESRRLLPDLSNAIYAPAADGGGGAILFARGTTLMAQPFDSDRLELVGDAVPLVEGVGTSGTASYHGFTVDAGGALAYVPSSSTGTDRLGAQIAWVDRAGTVLEPIDRPANVYGLALSPDEMRVAFVLNEGQGVGLSVWVRELASGRRSLVKEAEPGLFPYPRWSPDGRQLAYTSVRSGTAGLYVTDTDRAEERELLMTEQPGGLFVDDWSPDGRFLLYGFYSPGPDLYTLPLTQDGTPSAYLATEYGETSGRFSPDGRWVAYDSNESGENEVYVRAFPSAGQKVTISTNGGFDPVWSHDGRELYYLQASSDELALMVVTVGAGDTIAPGAPRELFRRPSIRSYAPSRDGQRFLIISSERAASGDASSSRTVVFVSDWREKFAR